MKKFNVLTLVLFGVLVASFFLSSSNENFCSFENAPGIIMQSAAIVLAAHVGRVLIGGNMIHQVICGLAFGILTGFVVLSKNVEHSPIRMILLGSIVTAIAVVVAASLAAGGFKNGKAKGNEGREGEGKKGSSASNNLGTFVMVPHLHAESSDEAIAKEKGKIDDEERVLNSIREREKSMPTGLDHGLAVPHGRTNAIKNLVGVVALVDDVNGIPNYETIDKSPVRIVVLSVSSEFQTVAHLHLLSEISRRLRDDDSRQELLACSTEEEMVEFLSNS